MHPPATLDPADAPPVAATPRPTGPGWLRFLVSLLAWAWWTLVGSTCAMSYLTAFLLAGWLDRLVQGRVVHGWWRQSRWAKEGTFEDFTKALGQGAPVLRPRWFLRQSFDRAGLRQELLRRTADGDTPGWLRQLFRLACMPLASLLSNLRLGALTVLGTSLIVGWSTLLMTFSWEFGWLNSFTKGYEVALVGPLSGLGGLTLFALTMLYLPAAQTHMAVTGDFRAFFDFRFVWRLVRARLTAYVFLAGVFLFFGVVLEVFKVAPAFLDGFVPEYTNATEQQLYQALQQYYFVNGVVLFAALVATRLLAGRIYRSAVLKVLRRGRAGRDMVHPRLLAVLEGLGIYPEPAPTPGVVERVTRAAGRWWYRRLGFALLFLLWLGFGVVTYVGEFFNYHPIAGFLNRPLIQVPCVNYIPDQLAEAAKGG